MKDALLDTKIIKKVLRKERLRRFHTRLQRWDILIVLSAILFVQILVIIYFSEWQMWSIFNNSFFNKILVPTSEDRTLYNIAISYSNFR